MCAAVAAAEGGSQVWYLLSTQAYLPPFSRPLCGATPLSPRPGSEVPGTWSSSWGCRTGRLCDQPCCSNRGQRGCGGRSCRVGEGLGYREKGRKGGRGEEERGREGEREERERERGRRRERAHRRCKAVQRGPGSPREDVAGSGQAAGVTLEEGSSGGRREASRGLREEGFAPTSEPCLLHFVRGGTAEGTEQARLAITIHM